MGYGRGVMDADVLPGPNSPLPPPFSALTAEVHEARMRRALRQAALAAEAGEVPVGAVIYHRDRLVAQAFNQTRTLKDPTAHAEMLAITQAASALGDWRLLDCALYVTLEPCAMCSGAIVLARIPLVVWGAPDPQRGGAVSCFQILDSPQLNHRPALLGGVLQDECSTLLLDFFKSRRTANHDHPTTEVPPP